MGLDIMLYLRIIYISDTTFRRYSQSYTCCIYVSYTYQIQPDVCKMLLSNMVVVHE